jgi:hypothetical protein
MLMRRKMNFDFGALGLAGDIDRNRLAHVRNRTSSLGVCFKQQQNYQLLSLKQKINIKGGKG